MQAELDPRQLGHAQVAALAHHLRAQLVGVGVQLEVGGAFAEAQQSGGGEGMVERVGQRQQHQVGMACDQAELLLGDVIEGALVAQHQDQAARAQHFAGAAQGQAEQFARSLGRRLAQLAIGPQ